MSLLGALRHSSIILKYYRMSRYHNYFEALSLVNLIFISVPIIYIYIYIYILIYI